MIRHIFLDLDNTLLDFKQGEFVALKYTFSQLNIPINDQISKRYLEINLSCWRALERGEITRDQVVYGRFEKLFPES